MQSRPHLKQNHCIHLPQVYTCLFNLLLNGLIQTYGNNRWYSIMMDVYKSLDVLLLTTSSNWHNLEQYKQANHHPKYLLSIALDVGLKIAQSSFLHLPVKYELKTSLQEFVFPTLHMTGMSGRTATHV